MASAGDRLQIVIGAKDELSGQLRHTRKELTNLGRAANDMHRRMEAGEQGLQDEYEQTRVEMTRVQSKMRDLQEQQKRNNAEYRKMTTTGRVAAMNLTRSFDVVSTKLRFTEGRAGWLRRALERLDNGAFWFRTKWSAALASVQVKMAALRNSAAFQALMSFARTGLLAGGAALAGGVALGLTQRAQIENQQIALEQLLGTKKKAAETMKWIVQAANETPFGMADLAGATQKLLGFGFGLEDTKKKLITIGDVAAGTGTGAEGIDSITRALGQMQAKQKITGEEMMQLTEAGIPAWKILAKEMGMSTKELMEMASSQGGGATLFETGGMDKLFKGLDKTYGGVMEQQAKTLGGRWSTFTDTLRTELGNLFKGKSGKGVKGLLKWAAEEMPKAFKTLKPYLKDFVDMFERNWPQIQSVLKGIGWVFKNILWRWITISYKAVFFLLTWLAKLVRWIVDVGAPAIGRFAMSVGRWFTGMWKKAKDVWDNITGAIRTAKDKIVGFVQAIKDKLTGIWDSLTSGLSEKTQQVKDWLKSMIPGLDLILFAGGPVNAGQTALVGEIGPELFVPNAGNPRMVGVGGPEVRDFHTSGTVIPNVMIGTYMAAQAASSGGAASAPSGGVHIENLTVQDKFDARREFEAMMARQRRIAAERS